MRMDLCRVCLAIGMVCWPAGRALGQADPSESSGERSESAPRLFSPEDTFIELTPQSEAAIRKGLDYLARTQLASGAWASQYGPNMGVCALCMLAFLAAGHVPGQGEYAAVLDRGLDFVLSHAAPSGLIHCADGSSHGPMYEHALATLLLSEVYGMCDRPEVPRAIEGAVRVIVHCQNEQGGWRYQPRVMDADISVTVMQIVALRAAKNAGFNVPKRTIERAIKYVKSCAHESGGFLYQQHAGEPGYARTGAGVCSLEVAGDYDSRQTLKGLDYLIANINQRTEEHYYYGLYYAAQAVYQAKDVRRWRQWFPTIRQDLLARQQPDGRWESRTGAPYATAMAVLVLSVPYRYLPIYQR